MNREDCFLVDNENLGSSTYTVPCDIYNGEYTNPLSIYLLFWTNKETI